MNVHEVISISRAQSSTIDINKMAELKEKILQIQNKVPGFISETLWEKVDDPFSFMMIARYASEQDSIKGWEAFVKSPVMESVSEMLVDAPNLIRAHVRKSEGLSLEKAATGQFCSLSTRMADMGYGADIVTELDGIFQELKLIDGFLGYSIGQLVEIEDEIVGVALWDTKKAFEASIPKKAMYRIDLYSKAL